jgi:hypothetical protein
MSPGTSAIQIMHDFEPEDEAGPWSPGIESTLPAEFLPLSTVFRPENVLTDLAAIQELSGFSGMPLHELTEFRPERLAAHELLIRITSDLHVPDGTKYEDLGANFRRIASTILSKYIEPHMDEVRQIHSDLKHQLRDLLAHELEDCFPQAVPHAPPPPARRGPLSLLRRSPKPAPSSAHHETPEERDLRIVESWNMKAAGNGTELERRMYRALMRVASAVSQKHGRLVGGASLFSDLAIPLVGNDYGSELIGTHIEQYFNRAVEEEGLSPVPAQSHPVVMKIKGASASGKSTMRPMQKMLAQRLGIPWTEFALIAPDVWRRFLLDFGSLGPARKYGGTLTGQELAIADKKLDRYLADKAANGRISHMLLDRFRFDSPIESPEGAGVLSAQRDQTIYMFFLITPPEATIERAWHRGERRGRYKAVDDLLYHHIEACNGMPRLLFSWIGEPRRKVHFEFLDNGVPEGARPRTVAFGTSDEMNILDIERLLDIDRYKKINLDARSPDELFPAGTQAPGKNTEFLRQCVRRIPAINFVDHESGRIYARVRDGKLTRHGPEPSDPDTRAGLEAVTAELSRHFPCEPEISGPLALPPVHTLGSWGGAGRPPQT